MLRKYLWLIRKEIRESLHFYYLRGGFYQVEKFLCEVAIFCPSLSPYADFFFLRILLRL